MKSSIRSKLFLLVYGLILAFIAGLILLNNSYLENYYIENREQSLIEAFDEISQIDLDESGSDSQLQSIEENYNLNIQLLKQTAEFEDDFVWVDFDNFPDVYTRIYGSRYNIPEGILGKIIYDFNMQLIGNQADYAVEVTEISDQQYRAYLMDIQSEFNINNEDTYMIGLIVAEEQDDGFDLYYVLTITFQSIRDSIKIFNSFTILVGFLFMVIAFVTMYFISYSFTNPILQISKIAQDISNLDFSNRLTISSDDEFGDLAKSINRMSAQLESNIKELQKTNDRLAQEILQKTDIDKMRREFIASASHELKTPLSLIMGYAEALKLKEIDTATRDEYLNIILDETSKMNQLVMELLKLSQLESGHKEIDFVTFNIRNLLEETANLFHLVFEENKIKAEVKSIDIELNSDYSKLQTVLTNFINNAINHVDEQKDIKISAMIKDNKDIRVSVFNTGHQIPDMEIDHIWDSFYKIDKARTRSYGGQGLGLSICRTILDLLGYEYGVINHPNGVEFYFEIYQEE